jgi:hypothetical protein
MMGRFALLGCVVLSALVATSPAQAEGGCPTGMFPIRSGINGYFAGCHPIYNSGEAQYSPSWNPPSRREPTIGEVTIYRRSYVAVVLHPKSADVWATWNQRSDEQAQQSALKACNQVMGNGCLVASSGYNGSVAIGYSPDKRVWVGWGEGPGDARDQMKQYCAQGKQKCELKHIFSGVSWPENLRELGVSEIDHSENYFPGLPGQGQKHVMMAWPKVASKTLPWRNSVWLGSGQQVTETAKQRLLDKCKQESGNECKIGLASPNGVIVRYFDSSLGVVWSTHASRKAAKSAIEFRCLLANLKCEILDVYDAETSRLEVIGTTKKINRGYLAVAWPGTSKSSWRNIVVSTGNATLRDAQVAAIAHCETESRAKCVSLGDIDDLGGRFFGLYLDSQDQLRSYDSFTEEQIETYAQDDCSATDVSCQKVGMFDTRKSGTIVQSIGN